MSENMLHEKVIYLLSAIRFTVGRNYRRIALLDAGESSALQFVIENDSDVDREFINEAYEEYTEWIDQHHKYAYVEKCELNVVVSGGALPILNENWEIVYQRRDLLPSQCSIIERVEPVRRTIDCISCAGFNDEQIEVSSGRLQEFHVLIFYLNRFFCGLINWNFRYVSIGWNGIESIVYVVLEDGCDSDIDAIHAAVKKFSSDFCYAVPAILISNDENIPLYNHATASIWFSIYSRRLFFNESKEEWEPLDYFIDALDYSRFLDGFNEMIRRGIVIEVDVERPLCFCDRERERWFRYNRNNEIWRLISPKNVNDGQFTKV